MAGEGKKREKFHTHRAGKLDQENLYTGAAHLYPPLNRSYPPSKLIHFYEVIHIPCFEMVEIRSSSEEKHFRDVASE